MEEFQKLEKALDLAVTKKGSARSASIAYSQSDLYIAGSIASDTHIFSITSEHAALALSTLHKDYKVNKMVTLVEEDGFAPYLPIIGKIFMDHSMRTGIPIAYTLYTLDQKVVLGGDRGNLLLSVKSCAFSLFSHPRVDF